MADALVLVTRHALLVVRRGSRWTVEQHLLGRSPDCVAIDPHDPGRLYCGTLTAGLFVSGDGGRHWDAAGSGIPHAAVTAVAVDRGAQNGSPGTVYAGTEPSALFRSDDGGASWEALTGLNQLPSAPTWSFPPRPETHHVRWIEADVNAAGRLFVAIEAGALARSFDGGRSWHDRVPGGPYDTHTAATHPLAEGRVYSAAGDGYFESADAGSSWHSPHDGLRHRYLVGIGVDPRDPDTVVVSASDGPFVAYRPESAEAYVYRRTGRGRWEPVMTGLPPARGTTVSRFATRPDDGGVIYAANNHGVFASHDSGRSWQTIDVTWPDAALRSGVAAFACLPE